MAIFGLARRSSLKFFASLMACVWTLSCLAGPDMGRARLIRATTGSFTARYPRARIEGELRGLKGFAGVFGFSDAELHDFQEAFPSGMNTFPDLRASGAGWVFSSKEGASLRLIPTMDGRFLVTAGGQQTVWTPSGSMKDDAAALEAFVSKSLNASTKSAFHWFEKDAHALIGTILVVALVAAVIAAGYYLIKKVGKGIDKSAKAATDQINKIGGTVNDSIKQNSGKVGSAIDAGTNVLNSGSDAIKSASQSASELTTTVRSEVSGAVNETHVSP